MLDGARILKARGIEKEKGQIYCGLNATTRDGIDLMLGLSLVMVEVCTMGDGDDLPSICHGLGA